MQTLTIRINNSKTLKLLEDLEALNLIVIKKNVQKEKAGKEPNGIRNAPETNGLKTRNASLRKLLLNGPVFTDKQIKTIEDTHKSINEWRTK